MRSSTRRPSGGSTWSSRPFRTSPRDSPVRFRATWCPPLDRAPDLVWEPDEVREALAEYEAELDLGGAAELEPFPRGQAHSFEAQRPAIAARGLAEAENELAAFVRAGNRVVVAFPHRGEALRTTNLLRRVEARLLEPGERSRTSRSCCSPSRPRAAASSGATSGSCSCRTRRSSASAPARGRAAAAARCRASPTCAQATSSSTRTTASGSCSASRRRRSRRSLATTSSSASAATTGSTSRTSRSARSRSTSAPTRPRPPSASSAARPGRTSRAERARACASSPASCSPSTRGGSRRPGVAFDLSNDWLERLEAEFPYRETEDQRTAIEAVKEDLEAPRPMDRLVCGDVGFGKTEVAVRAAFAVAVNGKQTLMLVPTTVLAEQHWNTFRERYRDFPVRVEMISRFRSPKEQKQVVADFAAGKVDVLIGTHRVLSRDVIPKELGLVIVDEEQRFGVAQKELLRALRLEVDVLSLSATPIPRTLHMSLSGLRDISVIETPPEGRRPIRTYVGEYDEELVKAGARARARAGGPELLPAQPRRDDRGGGGEDRRSSARACACWSPTARCASASSRSKMHSFLRGDADVLVSTTIIESGPRHPAGEHADRRARGRARARPALPDPRARRPLGRARARLPLLSRLAGADAGGARAAGDARRPHRARRGLCDRDARPRDPRRRRPARGGAVRPRRRARLRALRRAARPRRLPSSSGERRPAARPVRVEASVDAYVPATYIEAEALKIDLHRRLALTETEDELRELRAATEDRYGPLPEPVENLFAIQEAKLKLAQARRRLPRLPRRPDDRRAAPARLRRAARAARGARHGGLHERPPRGFIARSEEFRAALRLVDAILDARRAA